MTVVCDLCGKSKTAEIADYKNWIEWFCRFPSLHKVLREDAGRDFFGIIEENDTYDARKE